MMFTLPLLIFFLALLLGIALAVQPAIEAWHLYRTSTGDDVRPLLAQLSRLGVGIVAGPVFWLATVLIPRVTELRISEDLPYAIIMAVLFLVVQLTKSGSYRFLLRELKHGGHGKVDGGTSGE